MVLETIVTKTRGTGGMEEVVAIGITIDREEDVIIDVESIKNKISTLLHFLLMHLNMKLIGTSERSILQNSLTV
jgi:hypothetical protein